MVGVKIAEHSYSSSALSVSVFSVRYVKRFVLPERQFSEVTTNLLQKQKKIRNHPSVY